MNAINWFEIPVTDTARATKFYSHLLASELERLETGGDEMVMLPCDYTSGSAVGGALSRSPNCVPSATGTVVYLAAQNYEGGLDGCVARAKEAGGEIVVPRTSIGEHGFFALFRDSEGNTVGLHAMS